MTHSFLHYLPILTTEMAGAFCIALIRAWRKRRTGPHLLWWAFGAFSYGLGTLLESSITLAGNSVLLTKTWYIAGALLGGYPLAQGVAFLHLERRLAVRLAWITSAYVGLAAILVALSPVDLTQLSPALPSGRLLAWHWVRLLTPPINLYSFVFLVGGALVSAMRFRRDPNGGSRFTGNLLIAVGGLLPGIGGAAAKAGSVEALYVLELVGLVFIWIGYGVIVRSASRHRLKTGQALAGAASTSAEAAPDPVMRG
ncbi:MAG: hypothetical protein HYR64_02990 [Fimbriimonas ginsengisoli]|uniref:Histidine kinase N-terminal 7TM region domain-containing protein n=1 Tax=Fimbriimonas ginsengisoli TaxID=1005039 RepID=A0A931LTT8_FIMGI|nr:hypothetical protein [Fimbriimonas ginsengisoli]